MSARDYAQALTRPIILGLETSCDETAAAVVADGVHVVSNVIATQHALHEDYAGVVPEIASRAHLERLTPVVREALQQAGITLDDVDAIAVGHRPGLIGSLLVGVSAAKALAWSRGLPLVGVDHVMAHLHAPLLRTKEVPPPYERGSQRAGGAQAANRGEESSSDQTHPPAPSLGGRGSSEGADAHAAPSAPYPAIGLVVSGGHTSLYLLNGPLEIELLGKTIDDAVGEAFDKAATMLGLGYPGGPAIDRVARLGNPKAHALPVSLIAPDSLDFSFSGLKTALLYAVHGQPERGEAFSATRRELSPQQQADLAASFEHAAIAAVMKKLERALRRHPARAILVGGGVSANTLLRKRLRDFERTHNVPVLLAPMEFCVDNAAMIAGAAAARYRAGRFDDLTLSAAARSAIG